MSAKAPSDHIMLHLNVKADLSSDLVKSPIMFFELSSGGVRLCTSVAPLMLKY